MSFNVYVRLPNVNITCNKQKGKESDNYFLIIKICFVVLLLMFCFVLFLYSIVFIELKSRYRSWLIHTYIHALFDIAGWIKGSQRLMWTSVLRPTHLSILRLRPTLSRPILSRSKCATKKASCTIMSFYYYD